MCRDTRTFLSDTEPDGGGSQGEGGVSRKGSGWEHLCSGWEHLCFGSQWEQAVAWPGVTEFWPWIWKLCEGGRFEGVDKGSCKWLRKQELQGPAIL